MTKEEKELAEKLMPLIVAMLRANVELIPLLEVAVECRREEPRGLGVGKSAAKLLKIIEQMAQLKAEHEDVFRRRGIN